ncbi:alpha/beta fold hydrolase [Tahibacter harae]|uniref:Alpha/beta hydrolase n=1 Tax=Tahibacter harae TaxID=2963937 RepID=A0ABT1QWA2_9GAMM|nr:alpha/beta fold hydrolase [Tahibacter harae]MCQ4166567.1 alpha/beta hydrolase [Tahibacter harae]
MEPASRHRLPLSGGSELVFWLAGDPAAPALLLLHGFPSSAPSFRGVIAQLAQVCQVIAPDLPGYGESAPLAQPSFDALGRAVHELLAHLAVGPRYIYLHDYGAPVGLQIAMQQPDAVLGLLIQNANAHRSGFGPQWKDTLAYWEHPDAQNEAAATAHLNLAGVRDQYIAGLPAEVAARIPPAVWQEDWRIMGLPGRLETQRALIADYGNYVARFDAIARYLAEHQPRAVLVWGRHDAFFDIAETLSWMRALPRMEAHVLDGGHFLLETHAPEAGRIFRRFIAGAAPRTRLGARGSSGGYR